MKAIAALCAAVALAGCAYNDPYLYNPYGAPPGYYGASPYPAPYYYGVPYGYGPFGYDYPGYYYPDVRPGSPWAPLGPRPRHRQDGTAAGPSTPRPEGGGSGYPAPPPVSSGGGGSGYNPGASNAGPTGGGGSGYVPNQPPDK